MNELTAHFKVKDGKPEWVNPTYLKTNIGSFEGCKGILYIKRKWNKRSKKQNAWMWKCFEVLSQSTGQPEDDIKRLCEGLYSPKKRVNVGNKEYVMPKRTSELTVGQHVDFMMGVNSFAGSLGITLPDPEEYQRELDSAPLLNNE